MQTHSRVYDNYAHAQQAVSDLESKGIPSSDISLVANKSVSEGRGESDDSSATGTGAGIGLALGSGVGLLTGLGLMAIPGLGPVVAAGWLATTAAVAVAGTATGGVIGALIDAGTPESDAHVYSEAVRRGGTLVTVRTNHSAAEIDTILNRHSPIDTTARRNDYEAEGWTEFDEDAPAYQPARNDINEKRAPSMIGR